MIACCTQSKVAPPDAVMIGDAPQDILAGKNAGCRTIALASERFVSRAKLADAAPDHLFANASELLAYMTTT